MLIKYYSHTEYIRTPRQIRRDETILFGRVRCKAWMIIPLAVLSQFCLGSLYAWSIFNKPIDKYVFDDPEANRAQITFYIALGMLGASGAALGPWVESHPPKVCAALAAAVFFAGHCTAALGLFCKEIGMLYFGYGFVGGIGLGLGYVTTIDAVIQWYPNARGLASGLAVSGFGSGATAFSNLNAALIRRFSVPQVFVILGAINFVVMILCAVVMRPPPPNYNLPGVAVDMMSHSIAEIHCPPQCSVQQTIKGKSAAIGGQTVTVGSNSGDPVLIIPLAQALSSADFWLLWVAFFVNLVFGVVIISNLASMTTNMFGNHIPAAVTTIVTIEGAFNASGRLFFGWVSDWVGRRRTFLFIITLQIAIVACLIVIIPRKTFWPFVVLVWLATLCYGGGVGVIPATLADMFGASNMSGCHGVILTGWSVAAIGGGLTYTGVVALLTKYKGHTLGDPSVYVTNLYWILSLLVCGWFVLLFVRVTPRERMYPKVHGQ
ncbi:MFS general substrate transporter, partial [Martensiomyces pterosporus]